MGIRELNAEEGEELSSKYQHYHHHPPPTLGELCELSNHQPIRITIKINVFGENDHQCTKYECTLLHEQLYVYIPDATIEKSRQAFIRLLEFAEEDIAAKRVVVYFEKKNPDRAYLVRLFNFMGFVMLPPNHHFIQKDEPDDEMMYMATMD